MKPLIVMALLLIVGQASASDQVISVQHDSVRGVTCWILNNTGISCLPDSSLPQRPTISTTGEAQAERASMVDPAGESEALGTTPLPQEKRTQI